MIKYTLYEIETGAVLQSGTCPDESCLPETPSGATILIGFAANPDTQRVQAGQLVTVGVVPTTSAVSVERDRRIALGFKFPFPDGKLFQVNIPNISAAMSSATAAVVNGSPVGSLRWYDPHIDFTWIAMDNTTLTMDARTMIMFGQTATAFMSAHFTAARTIKNRILAGETLVIADDSLWPFQTG